MNKWIIYPKKTNNIIDQLLINRNIKLSEKEKFLYPDFHRDLLDPFRIKNMDKVVERIKIAIEKKEKIGIFADYDADGIPGAAILNNVLKQLGLEIFTYIPSRKEGYGLNKKGILELKRKECSLLISIDLGITNKKEVSFAKKNGFDVIITDHHEIEDSHFPVNADIIIHTHLAKKYANKNLAGGALAYKILQALSIKIGKPTERELKWLLDLPAISTICDMVPLIGENRVIAKYGLIVLSKTKNPGLQKLYQIASIDPKTINSYKVGFLIGPRINAPSRMKYNQYSYELLIEDNTVKLALLAKKINDINTERQKTLDDFVLQSKAMVQKEKLHKNKIIIIKNKNWPLGLLGLIASRTAEEFTRPTIAFTEENGILRGSARSIEAINILKIIKYAKEYIENYGGHTQAAGVSIRQEEYKKFYKKIINCSNHQISDTKLVKKIKIDYLVDFFDLTLNFLEKIKLFEPFGLGNPKPLFLLKNAMIYDIKWLGKEKNHLKLKISDTKRRKIFNVIKFNCFGSTPNIKIGDSIDLVFALEDNFWNGQHFLQLQVVDFRKSL